MIQLIVFGVVSLIGGLWLGHFLTVEQIWLWSFVAALVFAIPAGLFVHAIDWVLKGTVEEEATGAGFLVGASIPLSFIIPACIGGFVRKAFDAYRLKQEEA
ncbi:hypothetical protein [Roseovarius sp. EL26]|uniref:hypothetical protein n=1 Tax=Roseovarius sp. EL26 TaxID=2126672 RepID=UPI000EA1AB64|nr:hypothetical protein [Roseovarius sp. EL26]